MQVKNRDSLGRFLKGYPPQNYGRGSFQKGHKGFLDHPNKTSFNKGHIPWNKGIKGIRVSMRTAFKKGCKSWSAGRFGPLSSNWRGGRRKIIVCLRALKKYKEWRNSIYKRDNWACIGCGKKKAVLEVHHIKPLTKVLRDNKIKTVKEAVYCKEVWSKRNAITLCIKCHDIVGHKW